MADAAIEVAEHLADATSLARSLRAKANALYALDHHAEAIKLHERAVNLFEQVGDDAELARTLSGSIQPLLLLGRYNDALCLRGASPQNLSGSRATRAGWRAWKSISETSTTARIGSREAVEYYQRAYDELLKHDDAEGLAAVLSNLSLCYISLNDFPKALELHRMARQHCEQKGYANPGRVRRLQHRVPLFPARRIRPRHPDAAGRRRQRKEGRRHLSASALQSRFVRNLS